MEVKEDGFPEFFLLGGDVEIEGDLGIIYSIDESTPATLMKIGSAKVIERIWEEHKLQYQAMTLALSEFRFTVNCLIVPREKLTRDLVLWLHETTGALDVYLKRIGIHPFAEAKSDFN